VANTFLVLRTNDTGVQVFWHDGQNIDSTGIGALPGAALESVGAGREFIKHNNRVVTFLDITFVIQDGIIYKSTDEAATFASDHALTGTSTSNANNASIIAPVPVMVSGLLNLIGFYVLTTNNIGVMIYDVAGDSWSSVDTGVSATSFTDGATTPVVFQGLVYARVGDAWIAYDPVSTGTLTLTGAVDGANSGSDQMIVWNGSLWNGPHKDITSRSGMAQLVGSTWDIDTNGVTFSDVGTDLASGENKAAVFIDPNTSNLIVIWSSTNGTLFAHRVTPGLVVTDITGTVVGAALTTLGANVDARLWPHITRAPSGAYTVTIYGSRGAEPADPVERFEWVDDATQITEVGVVGGSGDMAFPYAITGGDQYGFFVGEKRTLQTAQISTSTGINITCEAFEQGGTTFSVRGHFDREGVDANSLTLSPMTVGNPTGTGGLSVSGGNPGAQIDGVPADRTPVLFDWDQVSDGFVTGDNFNFQLEAL
jgi:hypothetical protein